MKSKDPGFIGALERNLISRVQWDEIDFDPHTTEKTGQFYSVAFGIRQIPYHDAFEHDTFLPLRRQTPNDVQDLLDGVFAIDRHQYISSSVRNAG